MGCGYEGQTMHRAADGAAPKIADPVPQEVRRAIDKLTSFHEGDVGVIDAIACGRRARPALRAVLFAREPSGLYEGRRRAVEALAQLHAYDILIDYLSTPREISDPIELTGEEAVINAAVRALGKSGDARALPLLLEFAEHRPLAGAVEALGRLRRADALPYFIKALGEDFTRSAAEGAIRNLGPQARPALLSATRAPSASDTRETVSSRRQRRSALALFAELGPPEAECRPVLRQLMHDPDKAIAGLACQIELASASGCAKSEAVLRLIELLASADWLLRWEIEDCLTNHFDDAREIIARTLQNRGTEFDTESSAAQTARALRRVVTRVESYQHRTKP
jgi:HEAT repeat protein